MIEIVLIGKLASFSSVILLLLFFSVLEHCKDSHSNSQI